MIHDLQSVVCIMILRRGCCSNWTRFFKFNWARFIVDWLQSRTQKLFDCIEIAAFHWVNWFIRFFFHLEIVYKISISFFFFSFSLRWRSFKNSGKTEHSVCYWKHMKKKYNRLNLCNFLQYGRGKMVQLADLFSVPEISLLCNVAEYFEKAQLNYHPEILFRDVKVSRITSISIFNKIQTFS